MEPPTYLTIQDLANRLGVSVNTIKGWRAAGRTPRALQIAGTVRFRLEDVETWEREHTTEGQRS